MGLTEVLDTLERTEQLLEDGDTGPAQDSLSWQWADDDADIQLGKACAMLGTCRQLRHGFSRPKAALGQGRLRKPRAATVPGAGRGRSTSSRRARSTIGRPRLERAGGARRDPGGTSGASAAECANGDRREP